MRCRLFLTAVLTTAILASGCSGDKPAAQSPTMSATASATTQPSESAPPPAEQTTSAEAAPPSETLEADACVEITGANLNLAVATNNDDARKAGDAFEKYNPPADVREAIEHFVSTGGAQFDDPDYDRYNKLIDDWVKQVCPL